METYDKWVRKMRGRKGFFFVHNERKVNKKKEGEKVKSDK